MEQVPSFYGYVRENGDIGIRNHVLVITSEPDYINLVEDIVQKINGTKKIIPTFSDLDSQTSNVQMDIFLKYCHHPNVGKAIWIGSSEVCNKIENSHDIDHSQIIPIAIDRPSMIIGEKILINIMKAVKSVSQQKRKKIPVSKLKLAIECGGTDYSSGIWANPYVGKVVDRWIQTGGAAVFSETAEIIGADHLLLERAIDEQVRDKLTSVIYQYEKRLSDVKVNVKESNPTSENKLGGITTIEEKSLGAISKAGSTLITNILEYGNKVASSGLQFMDTPSFGPVSLSGKAAGGCQIGLFTTGVGNPYGDVIMPTIKVTASEITAIKKKTHIDFSILNNRDPGKVVDRLIKYIIEVASGKLTRSEIWGDDGTCVERLKK